MSKKAVAIPMREKVKEMASLFFILFALFALLSLFTYSEGDIKSVKYPPNNPILNKGGQIGASIAYFLYANFGIAAIVLAILIGFWAFKIFFRLEVKQVYIKLSSAFITVLAFATLMALLFNAGTFGLGGTAPTAGGVYGTVLKDVLVNYFGSFGTFLIVLLIISVSIILSTDWMVYVGVLKFAAITKTVSVKTADAFSRWRQKRAIYKTKILDEKRKTRLEEEIDAEIKRLEREDLYEQGLTKQIIPPKSAVDLTRSAYMQPNEPPPTATTAKQDKMDIKKEKVVAIASAMKPFEPPPIEIFEDKTERLHQSGEKDIKERISVIEATLASFDVTAKVVNLEPGPTVTIYELELAPGVKYSKVVGLADDLAISLKAPNVRIIAPIPGKSTIGVEVPNPFPDVVRIREFLKNGYTDLNKIQLPLLLGKTNGGSPIIKSLTEMPHLLVAGTTGSGKSVCLNAIITSLTISMSPDDLKILLIDPKMVELSAFKDIPHLWSPVLTDMKKAPSILDWLVKEMDERYNLLSRVQVRNIDRFNQLGEKKIKERLSEDGDTPDGIPTHLPYIIVIVDELADLMMMAAKEVEYAITRIAQKSRAVGIHLVVATQRPSVDVITGLIKSNMPARIAFKVAAKVDSRTILDQNGAERLLGKGDMLLLLPGQFAPIRAQCTYISDKEIRNLTDYLKGVGAPTYHEELVELDADTDFEGTDKDELFDDAVRIILETQRGSVSLLQRRLGIGYSRSARLVDYMAKVGIVGEYKGSSARDVLMTIDEWEGKKGVNSDTQSTQVTTTTEAGK